MIESGCSNWMHYVIIWFDDTNLTKGLTATATTMTSPNGEYNDPSHPHPRPRPPLVPFEFKLQLLLLATLLKAVSALQIPSR
jgi:hypothetical protein